MSQGNKEKKTYFDRKVRDKFHQKIVFEWTLKTRGIHFFLAILGEGQLNIIFIW